MATILYKDVVSAVVAAVGAEKGPGIVERQLQSKGISPDKFDAAQLQDVVVAICAAAKLYIADPGKKVSFEAGLRAMAK